MIADTDNQEYGGVGEAGGGGGVGGWGLCKISDYCCDVCHLYYFVQNYTMILYVLFCESWYYDTLLWTTWYCIDFC